MKTGIELIIEERQRQISQEGWTPEHDDEHEYEELATAAACYACPDRIRGVEPWALRSHIMRLLWPFDLSWFKPTPDDRVRELAKAGALIAAEIDRLNRKTSK